MGRAARWTAAVVVTVVVFGLCLWLFRYASFPWLPHAEADRWVVVAAGFATAAAGAVGAAASWWAGREVSLSSGQATPTGAVASALSSAPDAGGARNEISGGTFHGPVIQSEHVTVQLPAEVTPALSGLPARSGGFTGRDENLSSLLATLDPAALDQLGSRNLEVRVGGIYALERIAHDSPQYSPIVTDVLAVFIREHSREPWPSAEPRTQASRPGPRPDVQAAVTVIGRRNTADDVLTGLGLSSNVVVNLAGADLSGADLSEAQLQVAVLDGADLTGANLNYANLFWAQLNGADLTAADLSRAEVGSADIARANLTGARLFKTHLGGSDLTGANLTSADLTDADLNEVNLTAADLTGVNLTRTNLRRVRWPVDVAVPYGWQRRDADEGRLWVVTAPGAPEQSGAAGGGEAGPEHREP